MSESSPNATKSDETKSESSCTTDSLLPTWVTIIFICCSLVMLAITSWYSVKSLKTTIDTQSASEAIVSSQKDAGTESAAADDKKSTIATNEDDIKEKDEIEPLNDDDTHIATISDHERTSNATKVQAPKSKWQQKKGFGKFKIWFKDVWKRKAVYLPLIAHISDTATDFAAVIEFWQIASSSNASECGINVWYLFSLSIIAMFAYRIISSFVIWRITKSTKRVVFQFMDIELLQILWLSHRLGLRNKSSPHRLISILEAIFEAAPQTMIQLVYLLKTKNASGIIIFSFLLSFLNLTMTMINDDKLFFGIKRTDSENNICTTTWLAIYIFRFCDIPSQILMYVFLWHIVNGYILLAVVAIDVVVILYCYTKTKDTETLLAIVAMPFAWVRLDTDGLVKKYTQYSFLRCIIILTVIWVCIAFEGWPSDGGGLWMFCFIAAISKYCFYKCLKGESGCDVDKVKVRNDVSRLLEEQLFDDAISLIFYLNMNFDENAKKIHGGSGYRSIWHKYSLLAIAAGCDYGIDVFRYILNTYGLDSSLMDNKEQYTTALMVAARKRNTEYVKMIMQVADWDYILKQDNFRGSALSWIIEFSPYRMHDGNCADHLLSDYFGYIDDRLENDPHADDKKLELLSKVKNESYHENALHVVTKCHAQYDIWKQCYEFYPDCFKKEALMQRNKDNRTTLDSSDSSIRQYVQKELKSFNIEHE